MKANIQTGFFFKEDREDPLMLKYNLGVSSQVDIFSWKDRMAEKISPTYPRLVCVFKEGIYKPIRKPTKPSLSTVDEKGATIPLPQGEQDILTAVYEYSVREYGKHIVQQEADKQSVFYLMMGLLGESTTQHLATRDLRVNGSATSWRAVQEQECPLTLLKVLISVFTVGTDNAAVEKDNILGLYYQSSKEMTRFIVSSWRVFKLYKVESSVLVWKFLMMKLLQRGL